MTTTTDALYRDCPTAPHVQVRALPLDQQAVVYTRDLVRINSTNTGEPDVGTGELDCCRYIAAVLDSVGIVSELVETRPGRGSLIARLPATVTDPTQGALLLQAHVDVVPAVAADWSVDPFGGVVADGMLYGRGAADIKCMAGMMLAIAVQLATSEDTRPRELIFAFFADEEAAATHGAETLVRERPELFAGATHVIGEVGGFSCPVGDTRVYPVATGEKGVAWLTLTAHGRAGHGSRPAPDNAVVRIAEAVAAIGAHRFPLNPPQSVQQLIAGVSEILDTEITAETIADYADELGPLGPLVEAMLRDTASPGVLTAGSVINVVPSTAQAKIDCRILPDSAPTFLAEIDRILGPVREHLDIDVLWRDPIEADPHDPLVAAMAAAIDAEDPGAKVLPYLLPASTDNKQLAKLGIAGYGFVPLKVPADFDVYGQFHAVDECIPTSAVEFGARVLYRVAVSG